MLHLNLLAEESKQKIKFSRFYYLFLKTELFLLILVMTVIVIFLGAESLLAANTQKFGQEISKIIAANGQDYNARAKQINGQLAIITQIQAESVAYSQIFKKIAALVPPGVSLSYIKIDAPNRVIKIRGKALRRENLLALENNLRGADFLSKVEVPLQNKLKKDNVDFDIDLELIAAKLP
jgi:Tfp pilus assembly protein PilN